MGFAPHRKASISADFVDCFTEFRREVFSVQLTQAHYWVIHAGRLPPVESQLV